MINEGTPWKAELKSEADVLNNLQLRQEGSREKEPQVTLKLLNPILFIPKEL